MISLKEAVENAVIWEEKARDDYLRWASETTYKNVTKLLENLASLEQKHVNLLRDIDTSKEVYVDFSGMTYLDLTRGIVRGPTSEDQYLRRIFEYAMEKEQHSIERYALLASQVADPQVKKLFGILALEEKHHKTEILTEYNRLFTPQG